MPGVAQQPVDEPAAQAAIPSALRFCFAGHKGQRFPKQRPAGPAVNPRDVPVKARGPGAWGLGLRRHKSRSLFDRGAWCPSDR